MNQRQYLRGLALIGLVLGATAAAAHDTWLLPSRSSSRAGARVLLAMTSGMAFPRNETAIDPARIAAASMRLAGSTTPLTVHKRGSDALALDVTPARAGVATLWVELHPRTLALTPEQVTEYLEEIGAPAEVRERWEKAATPRRWRESYVKHAKTFVRVGMPTADHSWAEPVGMSFELIPEQDPTAVRSSEHITLRLLRHGAPAAGVAVALVAEGGGPAVLHTTDGAGRVTFELGRSGRWMARATELRPSSREELDWESEFTTLTFTVR
ncbi:MAG TPA: DUF4198 domain-containing protein [Thermoanaerobaculia bacterium]|nr:DUF4198 domain-containing protein [Thermoanaerobaculia bacterium]